MSHVQIVYHVRTRRGEAGTMRMTHRQPIARLKSLARDGVPHGSCNCTRPAETAESTCLDNLPIERENALGTCLVQRTVDANGNSQFQLIAEGEK